MTGLTPPTPVALYSAKYMYKTHDSLVEQPVTIYEYSAKNF